MDKYDEDLPLCQRTLVIREKVLPSNHPDVATSLNNLASLYEMQGRYSEAEPFYQLKLAILEKAFGPEHHNVATYLTFLARLCGLQGKYAEAGLLLKRAARIAETAFGHRHPGTNAIKGTLKVNRNMLHLKDFKRKFTFWKKQKLTCKNKSYR